MMRSWQYPSNAASPPAFNAISAIHALLPTHYLGQRLASRMPGDWQDTDPHLLSDEETANVNNNVNTSENVPEDWLHVDPRRKPFATGMSGALRQGQQTRAAGNARQVVMQQRRFNDGMGNDEEEADGYPYPCGVPVQATSRWSQQEVMTSPLNNKRLPKSASATSSTLWHRTLEDRVTGLMDPSLYDYIGSEDDLAAIDYTPRSDRVGIKQQQQQGSRSQYNYGSGSRGRGLGSRGEVAYKNRTQGQGPREQHHVSRKSPSPSSADRQQSHDSTEHSERSKHRQPNKYGWGGTLCDKHQSHVPSAARNTSPQQPVEESKRAASPPMVNRSPVAKPPVDGGQWSNKSGWNSYRSTAQPRPLSPVNRDDSRQHLQGVRGRVMQGPTRPDDNRPTLSRRPPQSIWNDDGYNARDDPFTDIAARYGRPHLVKQQQQQQQNYVLSQNSAPYSNKTSCCPCCVPASLDQGANASSSSLSNRDAQDGGGGLRHDHTMEPVSHIQRANGKHARTVVSDVVFDGQFTVTQQFNPNNNCNDNNPGLHDVQSGIERPFDDIPQVGEVPRQVVPGHRRYSTGEVCLQNSNFPSTSSFISTASAVDTTTAAGRLKCCSRR